MPKGNQKTRYRKTARVSKATKKYVKSTTLRAIETKMIVANESATSGVSVTYVNLFETLLDQQGVGSSSFIGREVLLESLRIKGLLIQADSSNVMRLFVIKLKGDSDPGDVMQQPLLPLYSDFNPSAVARIYMDRFVVLNQPGGTGRALFTKFINKLIKLKYTKLRMTGVGEIPVQYLMGFVSDSGFTAHPAFNYNLTLRYKDA